VLSIRGYKKGGSARLKLRGGGNVVEEGRCERYLRKVEEGEREFGDWLRS